MSTSPTRRLFPAGRPRRPAGGSAHAHRAGPRPAAAGVTRRLAAAALATTAFGLAAGPPSVGPAEPTLAWRSGAALAAYPAGTSALRQPLAAPGPTDPVRSEQWHLKTLNVAGAWAFASGEGVTVAVVDSGVDASHADLAGQVLPGLDLVNGDDDGRVDPVGHGTTVSALIAGRGDDSAGVVGIAPKAKILPVRVLDQDNRYDDALIVAKAVRWAADHGAKVVNLSLGGNGSSAALAAALDYAFAKDVVVVACTGNTSSSGGADVWYPAREPGVLAVTGLARGGDALWSGSITGKQTVVAAPATQLLGARPNGYWRVQGTSFAAPMVSGAVALIRSRWPSMPAAEVVNRVIRTAKDLGPPGHDDEFGYGMVDPTAALTAELPAVYQNPLDTSPSPGVARFGSAPSPGQALSAPEDPAGTGGVRLTGALAGQAAQPAEPADAPPAPGWWAAAALLAVSLAAAAMTIRRFLPLT